MRTTRHGFFARSASITGGPRPKDRRVLTLRAPLVGAGVAILLTSTVAAADVDGTYEVKYEEVSTNCASPLKYPHGKMVIKRGKGSMLTVDIDRTPLMQGSVAKGGKVSAKSKSGGTMLDGMTGVFSVA